MSGESSGKSKLVLLANASDEVKILVDKVISVEKENIHYKRPPRIKEILADAVREVIK